MLNATNTEFSFIEVWFTDQNSKQLEIEDNVNMTLITRQILQMRYSIEPKHRKYVERYDLLSFTKSFGNKYSKN